MDTLRSLCGDLDEFATHHWELRPLVHRNEGLADLLTIGEVDALICNGALPAPHHVRVANVDGARRDWVRWIDPLTPDAAPVGVADAARLLEAFAGGDTIVVRDVRRLAPRVDEFAHGLECEVGHPVTANAYLTPAGGRGLRPHYDLHHAFIVQTHGTKRWSVWPRHVEAPMNGYGPDRFGHGGEPWDVQLEPGDVLYIPRGHPHAGVTAGEASLHVTIAIRQVTLFDAVSALIGELIGHARFRRSLPLGFDTDRHALRVAMKDALADLSSMLDDIAVDVACDLVATRRHERRTLAGGLEALVEARISPEPDRSATDLPRPTEQRSRP